jgi:hypothetical protein
MASICRDVAGPELSSLHEGGEVAVDQLEILSRGTPVPSGIGSGQEIFLDGEMLEDVAAFHHLHDPPPHHLVRVPPVEGLAVQLDRPLCDVPPLGPEEPRDRLERGALACAVGPEEGDDAPLGDAERDALQHEDHMVVDHLDVVHRKEGSRILRHVLIHSVCGVRDRARGTGVHSWPLTPNP